MSSKHIPSAIISAFTFIYLTSLLTACGGGSTESASVPIVLDAPIAYVKRPVLFDDNGDLEPINVTDPIAFSAGGDLFIRDRAAASSEEINVTRSITGGMGDVKDVEFSEDGEKVIFAMREAEIMNADPEDQPKWAIWEYEISTDTLTQLSPTNLTTAGVDKYHYVSPAYLPNGDIIFTSTQQRDNQGILGNEGKSDFPGLTENRREQALVLHRMRDNGTGMTQLSFNQSHDMDPIVLQNGRILFSRWDNAGTRNAFNLYSINPDGTDLQLVYGAHSHDTGSNNSTIQFLKPHELENGNILALLAAMNNQSGGGLLTAIDVNNYIDNTSPTFVNAGLLGPAQTNLVNTTILTDGNPSPGGLYSAAYPLNDGTNRYLVSWTPCRLQDSSDPNFPDSPILPCSTDNLANANMVEAPPLYGMFMFDGSNNTQVPVVVPQEGIMFTDIAAASPKPTPEFIADKTTATGLDANMIDEEVGIINIRSVYDVDGVDSTVGIDLVSDPTQTAFTTRPARFIRIVKAVSIPDDENLDGNRDTSLDNSAYGVSTAQGMREIIGYAPVEPDGSVKVKVPANVPLAISILDKNGKRISPRHQNWIQVRKGDTLNCVGCHDHTSGSPHGRPDGPPSIYIGGTSNGGYFPNTDPAGFWHELGETMAEARTRLDPAALDLSVDIKYTDVWSDPAGTPEAPFEYLYADLTTSVPIANNKATECQAQWSTKFPIVCRTVINYESHIAPLWDVDRGASTCTNCHTTNGDTQAPAGVTQLDLSNALDISGDEPNHMISYRELLVEDNLQNPDGTDFFVLVDLIDPDTGTCVLTDPMDPLSPCVQVPQYSTIGPAFSTAGALANGDPLSIFEPGSGNVIHEGILAPGELKLIKEWLDIGAQYYNNPFQADPNRFYN